MDDKILKSNFSVSRYMIYIFEQFDIYGWFICTAFFYYVTFSKIYTVIYIWTILTIIANKQTPK